MSYKDFKLDFVTRTLKIVSGYQQEYEVTLLTNCLLGLIVLPKEKDFETIEATPLKKLGEDWGLKPTHIELLKSGSGHTELDRDAVTLRDVVKHLRHAVAHVGIEIKGDGRDIKYVQFENKNDNGDVIFRALIPSKVLRTFAIKLGTWYKTQLEGTAEIMESQNLSGASQPKKQQ